MDHYLRIEVERAASSELFEVHGARALVGSAAHCDVRLALDEAAPEQLELRLNGAVAELRVLAPSPRCLLANVIVQEATLARAAALTLGALTLRVQVLGSAAVKRGGKSSSVLPNWLQAVLLVALVGGFAFVLTRKEKRESVFAQDVPLPALFKAGEARCVEGDRSASEAALDGITRLAEAKRERAPFRPRDGVEAARLYQRIAACFQALGQTERAAEAERESARLQAAANDELRRHRVRLERFLATEHYELAQREVASALDIIHDDGAPYAHWLGSVRREIALHGESEKGAKR